MYQLQDDKLCTSYKPTAYFSRALAATETRYSQIEKECLALTWVAERSSDYILRKKITGETDHKPLVTLLTTHCIDQLPPRIQRIRVRLMRLHIKSLAHIPEKEMHAVICNLQSVTKSLSHPQIFSLFAPVSPLPPSQCCSTTKSCQITRVISIRYFFQNNIDMGERGDEKFIFF